jgi:hypothetical protein
MENNDNLNSLFDKLFKLVEDPKEKAKITKAVSAFAILVCFFIVTQVVPDLDEQKFKNIVLSALVSIFVVLAYDIFTTNNVFHRVICFSLASFALLVYFVDAAKILSYWNMFFPKGSSFPYEIPIAIFVFISLLYLYLVSQKNNNDGQ